MTDRDHFAAAALTGLLFHNHEPPKPVRWWVEQAYDYADAMLRERTNHDAVPAAIARTDAESDRTDKAAPRPGKGAGNTPVTQHTPGKCSSPRGCTSEPVAWAVVSDSKEEIDCEFIYPDEATAGDVALDSNGGVVPLYRHPQATLTDAEREAVRWAVSAARNDMHPAEDTLRGLLARCAIGHQEGRPKS